ncbi:hypothetical protein ACJVDH_12965 [Pedobacter sp. AW1-32]|uniref:hypothetical protein n=1 Tax=Pedobacter sp. AW1-32 TaxID=3383026 RepID=UPI003FEE9DCF
MNLKTFWRRFLIVIVLPLLTSCFQIVEEINLHNDGTGNVRLTINLSQSKTKVQSVMLLDSINGYAVPSKQKIQQELAEAVAYLKKSPGISDVRSTSDFSNYIATISFAFKDVSNINNITKNILNQHKIKANNTSSYSYDKAGRIFSRQYKASPDAKNAYNKLKNQDKAIFNGATYTSIYRFDSAVINAANPMSNVSKSRTAVMLKSNVMDLINGKVNVSNQIQLSK